MRLGAVAETPLEWLALASGRIPTPLVDTQLAFVWARTVMVATRLGVFEALDERPAGAAEVAAARGCAVEPTIRLLDALTGMGYLLPSGEREYALARSTRRWLTRRSADEVIDKVLFSFDEWRFVEHYERFLRLGEPLGMHEGFGRHDAPPEDAPVDAEREARDELETEAHDDPPRSAAWRRYQLGLHALSKVSEREVAARTPVPRGARTLLDIGGAHGRFAAALARRHGALHATVLDLGEAVAASADLLSRHGLGARLRHAVGDVRTFDLGEGAWDVVLASQFTHHLDDESNRRLAGRVARALRPGGVYVIQDLVRPASPREARRARLGALLDLYFAATSGAGTVTLATLREWQTGAGLTARPARWMRTLPGMVQQAGVRAR